RTPQCVVPDPGFDLEFAVQSRASCKLDQSGSLPRSPATRTPNHRIKKSGMIAILSRRPMRSPMVAAFHSNAHTPLPFVGLQGVEPRWSWTTRLQRAPAPYRSRAPKRKKPPRFPWVAPFLGMFHLLLERSPPSGVFDAILGRKNVARLG